VTAAFIGLGANLGEPRKQLELALVEIDRLAQIRVVRQSSFYRSAPLGHADQPEYVNAVAQLQTDLPPDRLLAELQAIETAHGRRRSFPNAPRTLDLDLLMVGDMKVDSPGLQLPHPRMHERAFVLVPLLEINPQAIVPGRGPAKALLSACLDQSVERIA
jgi:2-amino-4-hydroxy-6-hydroxymethyldihydropteridine diphosphokinase